MEPTSVMKAQAALRGRVKPHPFRLGAFDSPWCAAGHSTTRSPGHRPPGGDDARQVKRIGSGQRDQFLGCRATAHLAKESDRQPGSRVQRRGNTTP